VKTALLVISLVAIAPFAFAEIRINETLIDTQGNPLGNILVKATPQEGNLADPVEKRTDENGQLLMTLADGDWFIEVDQAELLERGYFCVPGSCLGPECTDLTFIDAVPLTPELLFAKVPGDSPTLEIQFDWLPGINPVLLRQHGLERSTDLVTWTPVASLILQDPPILFDDLLAPENQPVYYRTRPEPNIIVANFALGSIDGVPVDIPQICLKLATETPE